jgi:5'-nucleotidase
MSRLLKHDLRCDLVICLSHLGFSYSDQKISDLVLAKQTTNIDFILGGHTHTFLDTPVSVKNNSGKEVLVAQAGWAGIQMGRLDVFVEKKNKKMSTAYSTAKIF